MIEKSIYDTYQIDFSADIAPEDDDYIFIFNDSRELYLDENKQLPKKSDEIDFNFCLYI